MKTFTQKYSKIFYLTTAFIITLGIAEINYSYSQPTPSSTTSEVNQTDLQAQDSSSTNTSNQSDQVTIPQYISWNQTLLNEPANSFCNENGECGSIVEVVFESDNTLALESFNNYHIFRLADLIKNVDEFQIIDVSTTPQEGGIKYLVVMSR
jgi:hypothetical protein